MGKFFAMVFVVLGLLSAAGCSNVPVSMKHQAREQKKFRSVSHWNDLAYEVALEVRKAMSDLDYSEVSRRPMYIAHRGNSPFSEAFHEMLETSIVRMGLQVSKQLEQDSIFLEYDILTFRHDAKYKGHIGEMPGGIPARLGAAVVSLLADPYERPSDNEVLVTTSMSYNNRYILKNTSPYYIHDADFDMYRKREEGPREFRPVKIPAQNG